MSKKEQNNNLNNSNNNNNNGNNNNFFNNNPLLIFVLFSIVTIFAFKAIFPENQMGDTSGSNIPAFGQSSNKTVAYSDLKGLISSGKIEYVGIGNTQIKGISKQATGQVITYTARRVVPDDTLIPELEKNGISYGGVSEENILNDILKREIVVYSFSPKENDLLKNLSLN